MKILTPGHKYDLDNFENINKPGQIIQFIEKVQTDPPGNTTLITVHDGTTNEEVLKMLIDRLQFMGAKIPCRENSIVVTKLEESLMWLEKRTADRKARGVEGRAVP